MVTFGEGCHASHQPSDASTSMFDSFTLMLLYYQHESNLLVVTVMHA